MTKEELDAIEARVQASVSGPWEYDNESRSVFYVKVPICSIGLGTFAAALSANVSAADLAECGRFIAAARTDIPNLLAEVRRLQSENEAIKSQCRLMLQQRDEYCAEARYSTEAVDALIEAFDDVVIAITSLSPDGKARLASAVRTARASREPQR